MKLVSVVGARPQFVKLGPIVRAMEKLAGGSSGRIDHVIVHTGQHYDVNMSAAFFEDLQLPDSHHNLGVGSEPHGRQTGRILERFEALLERLSPDLVLTYGDTNSTLGGALAAAKLHIPVGHIEAGLRSYRKSMPEEINRVLSDHVSTLLFCPTAQAVRNLEGEGVGGVVLDGGLIPRGYREFGAKATADAPWVLNVGDVMKDALVERPEDAGRPPEAVRSLGLATDEYAVVTVHRAENTDDPERLKRILRALVRISGELLPVIFPVHPRTRQAMERHEVRSSAPSLHLIQPVGYNEMLRLLRSAQLVLTDSGGVQKEAFLLEVPCVTLRNETEWVELVASGWNRLADADEERIFDAAANLPADCALLDRPLLYGDGHAAERIVDVCLAWWAYDEL